MSTKNTQTLLCLLSVWLAQPSTLLACSTAVFGPAATADGAPLLWKNRDTDVLSNKVVFVPEKPFSYLGLVNAEETSGRSVYAGLNAKGFAIFNSVACNLPAPPTEMKDLEGQIMADALRTCRSVDDFEAYLRKNLGKSLGSQANFGVLDSTGHAALFEVHKVKYIDVTRLANQDGTGFLPVLKQAQQTIYEATAAFLQTPHTPTEFAQFQDRIAADALAALQKVR